MKEFISKWSNWWILEPKRKQLDEAFEKELNELIEREVALRIHDVVGRSEQLVCDRPKIKWKTTLPCYKCDGKGCYKCKQQKKAFEILEEHGVNVNKFIRQAIAEKIKSDWRKIKEQSNKQYCPF